MLFNGIVHSVLLHNTLMIFSDNQTHVCDSFKITHFVYPLYVYTVLGEF